MYIIEPPTMIGTAPRAAIASTSAAAALLVSGDGGGLGDVEDVELVVRDAAPLGNGSFAVPMSMPR